MGWDGTGWATLLLIMKAQAEMILYWHKTAHCPSVIMAAELLEQHRESYTLGQTLSTLKINHEPKWPTGRFQDIAELQLTTTEILFLCHLWLLAAASFLVVIREFVFVWLCPLAKDKGSSYFALDKFSSGLVSWTCSLRVFWKAKPMEEQWWKTRIRNMKKVWKAGWVRYPSFSITELSDQLSCLVFWFRYIFHFYAGC